MHYMYCSLFCYVIYKLYLELVFDNKYPIRKNVNNNHTNGKAEFVKLKIP